MKGGPNFQSASSFVIIHRMPFFRRLHRLLVLTIPALAILAISGVAANELAGGAGSTSHLYSFMHRVPVEVDDYGTEYEIGRVYIVHRSRLIKPLESIRYAVDWIEPTPLVGSGHSAGKALQTIALLIDDRFPDVPADIRARWASSIDGLVQVAVQDGPDAAVAYSNQTRDRTFSFSMPDAGLPVPEEVFRQGRIVVYPPSLKVWTSGMSLLLFLVIWVVGIVLLALATKAVAERIRRPNRTSNPTRLQATGSPDA